MKDNISPLCTIINIDECNFNHCLNNLLHEITKCTKSYYQELINKEIVIDFEDEQQILNTCRMFAIIRYVASSRGFDIKYPEIYFDKRLHLKRAYKPDYTFNRAEVFFKAPQEFYDYNVLYDTNSLITL